MRLSAKSLWSSESGWQKSDGSVEFFGPELYLSHHSGFEMDGGTQTGFYVVSD